MRRRKTKRRNRTSNFEVRVNHSRNVRECSCLKTHMPRNGHTLWPSECDDYATVCDNAAMKRFVPCTVEEEEEDYAFFFFFFSILCRAAFNAAYSHTVRTTFLWRQFFRCALRRECCQSRLTVLTSHGHIAALNKLWRRIRLLGNFSRLRWRLPIAVICVTKSRTGDYDFRACARARGFRGSTFSVGRICFAVCAERSRDKTCVF